MKKGFTLIELVMGVGIILVTILGVISVCNHSVLLNRLSEGRTLALMSAQAKLEEMRSHSFTTLQTDYGSGGNPGNIFVPITPYPSSLTGMGNITFFDQGNAAIGVQVSVSWSEKGRIFGEDTNLNGRLDPGEDTNGNGRLDSPVQLVTYFTG